MLYTFINAGCKSVPEIRDKWMQMSPDVKHFNSMLSQSQEAWTQRNAVRDVSAVNAQLRGKVNVVDENVKKISSWQD